MIRINLIQRKEQKSLNLKKDEKKNNVSLIKKGDIVARKSYNKDIIFIVNRIIKLKNGQSYVILKGVTVRIEADAPLEDIEKVDSSRVADAEKKIDELLKRRINNNRGNYRVYPIKPGKILHLDGDRKYSEKSARYYKKLGLEAIVKNIPESKQAMMVRPLLEKYNPDILIITRT